MKNSCHVGRSHTTDVTESVNESCHVQISNVSHIEGYEKEVQQPFPNISFASIEFLCRSSTFSSISFSWSCLKRVLKDFR